jgi:hypothetical protein
LERCSHHGAFFKRSFQKGSFAGIRSGDQALSSEAPSFSTEWAESHRSPRLQTKMGNPKKADAQGRAREFFGIQTQREATSSPLLQSKQFQTPADAEKFSVKRRPTGAARNSTELLRRRPSIQPFATGLNTPAAPTNVSQKVI